MTPRKQENRLMNNAHRKVPVAVLISGRGSNMQALVQACKDPAYPARICLVLSNNPAAPGIDYARNAGLATKIIDHRPFGKNRQAHENAVNDALHHAGTHLVCLAGYMRVLTPWLVDIWRGKMLNIHPSLLPAFPGLETHKAALASGVGEHGCTVHLVTNGVDEGPILAQRKVKISPDDTEQILAKRVLEQEHVLYPEALASFIAQLETN